MTDQVDGQVGWGQAVLGEGESEKDEDEGCQW